MKQNLDFTEIKKFCDKVGLNCQIIDEGVIITKPKDIWDGVEFFEGADGIIRKIPDQETLNILKNVKLLEATPSTEQAYIEQLKKEAFKRFGEIKKGDRFKADWINNDDIDDYCKTSNPNNWTYIKNSDRFFLAKNGGAPIYCEGKWAERVKERVKVVRFSNMGDINDNSMRFTFEISGKKIEKFHLYGVNEFLASQLEKYLNNEIE